MFVFHYNDKKNVNFVANLAKPRHAMPYLPFFLQNNTKKMILSKTIWLIAIFYLASLACVSAQGRAEPVYVSGVIIDGKSSEPVPAAHLYIPKAGNGTAANADGFFILPTMPGDSVVISCIGYKKRYYIIPHDKGDSYSVVIEMNEDMTDLPIVEVFAYPTEEMFKEAFLALELPDEEKMEKMQASIERNYMMRMAFEAPMDAAANHRNQMDRDFYRTSTRGTIPTLQLLNPFAWAQFIKAVKRGDYKRGRWKEKK